MRLKKHPCWFESSLPRFYAGVAEWVDAGEYNRRDVVRLRLSLRDSELPCSPNRPLSEIFSEKREFESRLASHLLMASSSAVERSGLDLSDDLNAVGDMKSRLVYAGRALLRIVFASDTNGAGRQASRSALSF